MPGDLRRIFGATRPSSQFTKNSVDSGARIVQQVAVNYQRTDNVPTLHSFVSARLADLTTAGGLTVRAGDLSVRARDMCRTVVSAAVSSRSAPEQVRAVSRRRPHYIVVGHDLPRITPGIERC
jgi:hypothetical protein